jgi:hypothetical protein
MLPIPNNEGIDLLISDLKKEIHILKNFPFIYISVILFVLLTHLYY